MKDHFFSLLSVLVLVCLSTIGLSCGGSDSSSDSSNTTQDTTTNTTPDVTTGQPDVSNNTGTDTSNSSGTCPQKKGNDFSCDAACTNLYEVLKNCSNQIQLTPAGQALAQAALSSKTNFMLACKPACATDTATNGYNDLWYCWQKASSSNCSEAAKCNSVNCPPN